MVVVVMMDDLKRKRKMEQRRRENFVRICLPRLILSGNRSIDHSCSNDFTASRALFGENVKTSIQSASCYSRFQPLRPLGDRGVGGLEMQLSEKA